MHGNFYHLPAVIAASRRAPVRGGLLSGPRGLGYVPQAGNILVDPKTADEACAGSFTTPGVWPPSMTAEAVSVLNQGAGTQFVWCGDDKKLYQVNANGTLQVCADGAMNQPAPMPVNTTCPPGSAYDSATGLCVPSGGGNPVPPTPVNLPGNGGGGTTGTSSTTSVSTPLLIVGGVVLVAAAAGLAYMATTSGSSGHMASSHPAHNRYR